MAPNRENTERRVRVIESNTDFEEMQAGHIIPGADPPKNDHARGASANAMAAMALAPIRAMALRLCL
jgi:hypothetical protein